MGSTPAFIMMMSSVTSNVSGHTKVSCHIPFSRVFILILQLLQKTTTTGIFLVGYSLGQILCTQFWKQKYRPENHVPWGITLMSHLCSIICLLILRWIFVSENKRREAMKAEAISRGEGLSRFEDYAIVDTTDKDGNPIQMRVDKMYLDLTDKENLAFRYVL